ncbi:MAG: general stress protein [Tardiphaga sp.]
MSKVTISRLFDDYADAQTAVLHLREAGVAEDDISIIANNADKWFAPDYAAGAGKGAAIGAGFGGFGGLLAGLGLLAVPGLGPVVAAGWLAAAAAGAVAAGAAGGVIGMLAEAGVAANEAEVFAESIRRGGTMVSAKVAAADKERLEAVLNPSSVDIAQRRSALASSGWSHFDPAAPDFTAEEIQRERGLRGERPA